MSNPLIQQHSIELGGKKFPLRFTHRDFATAEYLLRKAGYEVSMLGPGAPEFWKDIAAAIDADGKELAFFDPFKIDVLLFVGIHRAAPKLTFEQIQDSVTFENSADVAVAVLAAVREALDSMKKDEPMPEAAKESPLAGVNGGASDGASASNASASPVTNSGA